MRSLGRVTEKYGSAVTTRPNTCNVRFR
jgi:hypothetical protein